MGLRRCSFPMRNRLDRGPYRTFDWFNVRFLEGIAMNGISWLLLILIVLAFVGVVFRLKRKRSSGCGSCSGCASGQKGKSGCSGAGEQIIHIQKMGR